MPEPTIALSPKQTMSNKRKDCFMGIYRFAPSWGRGSPAGPSWGRGSRPNPGRGVVEPFVGAHCKSRHRLFLWTQYGFPFLGEMITAGRVGHHHWK